MLLQGVPAFRARRGPSLDTVVFYQGNARWISHNLIAAKLDRVAAHIYVARLVHDDMIGWLEHL